MTTTVLLMILSAVCTSIWWAISIYGNSGLFPLAVITSIACVAAIAMESIEVNKK